MNWGQKLVLAMALFMTFIVALGVMMFMNEGNDELIEQDYYQQGLNYDSTYRDQQNARIDSVIPILQIDQNGLLISFKESAQYKLTCKRLSDAAMDKLYEGEAASIGIGNNELSSGPWLIELHYQITGKPYLLKREIQMP